MKCWYAIIVCLPVLASAQQASRSAGYTHDVNGRKVEGVRTEQVRSASGSEWIQSRMSHNGRPVPLEKVEERVLREDSTGKVVERIIRPYDTNGLPGAARKVRVEERKNADGSATVLTTTYRGDLNGRFQLWEKATTSTQKSGDIERAETVVERPGLNGSVEVVEKKQAVTKKSASGAQEDVTVYRKDNNGRFIEAVREIKERSESGGEMTENATQYELGSNGLQLAGQTVTRTRKGARGVETTEVDVYSAQLPARPRDTGSRPQLRERLLYENKPGPANTVVETFSVSRPSLADPKRLGPWEKVSERVCSGDCEK